MDDVLDAVQETGPSPPTSSRPLTRRTSSPRACSSIDSQMPNAVQSSGWSKTSANARSRRRGGAVVVRRAPPRKRARPPAPVAAPSSRAGSTSPVRPSTPAPRGSSAPSQRSARRPASARSAFVTTSRSADRDLFQDSVGRAQPVDGVDGRRRRPRARRAAATTGSVSSVETIGAGSARPVVSTTTRRNGGISPRVAPVESRAARRPGRRASCSRRNPKPAARCARRRAERGGGRSRSRPAR